MNTLKKFIKTPELGDIVKVYNNAKSSCNPISWGTVVKISNNAFREIVILRALPRYKIPKLLGPNVFCFESDRVKYTGNPDFIWK